MKLLVDSDFLVALYKPDDSNNKKSKKIFKKIQESELYAISVVFQESTTVISKRMGMTHARKFFDSINRLIDTKIDIDSYLEEESWKIFLKQTKKGTSFVDCANLAVFQKYKFDGILTFDEFYPKETRVK